MHLNMQSAKWEMFCLGLNVLNVSHLSCSDMYLVLFSCHVILLCPYIISAKGNGFAEHNYTIDAFQYETFRMHWSLEEERLSY